MQNGVLLPNGEQSHGEAHAALCFSGVHKSVSGAERPLE